MRRRIDWKISFALFVLTPIVSLGTVPTGGVMRSPAVAQAPDTRTADAQPPDACKAKADELLQQGIAKFDVGHYEAAATPYQQA